MIGEYRKQNALPFTAGSAINPYRVVTGDASSPRQVIPLATNGFRPVGLNGPATALLNEAVTIYDDGAVVEAVAGASLGPNCELGVASTNGALGPASGSASGVVRWAVGFSMEAALAGEKFSLYVKPRQIGGAA